MRSLALFLLILCSGCAGFDPSAPPPLTRNEASALSPDRLARRVLGDYSRTLLPLTILPLDHWPGAPVLREVAFLTPPRFAGQRGLCETDFLLVRMEPVGLIQGGDTRVRPRRIEVTTEFVAREIAAIEAGGQVTEREAEREGVACAGVDPREVGRIRAPSAGVAARGLRLAFAFVRTARTGRAVVPLACRLDDGAEPSPEAACLAEAGAMRLENIYLIGTCHDPEFPSADCFDVQSWGTQLRIWVRPGTEEPVRAAVEHVIYIT
ncbi:MAG TPA: hypothetical protein VF693_05550 [Allosphingosinicella sp.]|jgi:hypothetical protein